MNDKTKNRIYQLWLGVIRWLRLERKTILQLRELKAEDVKEGQLYEYYGRIFRAECAGCDVKITYTITTSTNMNARHAALLMKGVDDGKLKIEVNQDGHQVMTTTDVELGEMFRRCDGVTVDEQVEGAPCQQCDMFRLSLPCPGCNFGHVFRLVDMAPQNSTNQQQYMRVMARKVNG